MFFFLEVFSREGRAVCKQNWQRFSRRHAGPRDRLQLVIGRPVRSALCGANICTYLPIHQKSKLAARPIVQVGYNNLCELGVNMYSWARKWRIKRMNRNFSKLVGEIWRNGLSLRGEIRIMLKQLSNIDFYRYVIETIFLLFSLIFMLLKP